MIKLLTPSLVFVLLLALAVSGRADVVEDLYWAEVAVADQSSKSLASASRDALSDVLVKASGSESVLRNPVVKEALGEARNQVLQYAYRRGEEADALYAEADGGGFALEPGEPNHLDHRRARCDV